MKKILRLDRAEWIETRIVTAWMKQAARIKMAAPVKKGGLDDPT